MRCLCLLPLSWLRQWPVDSVHHGFALILQGMCKAVPDTDVWYKRGYIQMEQVVLKHVEVSRKTFASAVFPGVGDDSNTTGETSYSSLILSYTGRSIINKGGRKCLFYFNDFCLIWQVVAVILLPLRYTPA